MPKCSIRLGRAFRSVAFLQAGNDLDGQVDGRVADGVQGHGPAGAVGGGHPFEVLLRGVEQVPGVVLVPAVVFGDRGGGSQQRPVHEDLDGTQRQVFVAEPRPDAEAQAAAASRAVGVGGVRGLLRQGVKGRHELGAGVQAAGVQGLLVGGDFDGGMADPAAAHAGLGEGGDALGRVACGCRVQRPDDLVHRVRQQQVLDESLCRFLDQAGGIAVRVADHGAAHGVGEVPGQRAGQAQRGGVGDRGVPGDVAQVQRAVPGDLVEPLDVREQAVVVLVVEPRAVEPHAGAVRPAGASRIRAGRRVPPARVPGRGPAPPGPAPTRWCGSGRR